MSCAAVRAPIQAHSRGVARQTMASRDEAPAAADVQSAESMLRELLDSAHAEIRALRAALDRTNRSAC